MSNEKIIVEFLRKKMNNEYAIFGILGNIIAESNALPNNVENGRGYTDEEYEENIIPSMKDFINDKIGYGLCQWTHWERKGMLYNYIVLKYKDYKYIPELIPQLEFMWHELTEYFKPVYESLKLAKDVYTATDIFCKGYEQPHDQTDEAIEYRSKLGTLWFDDIGVDRKYLIHEVKQGDTIRKLANLYGVKARDIIMYNNIEDYLLQPPCIVRVPTQKIPQYILYKVKKGDTLWGIAKRYTGDGSNHQIIMSINYLRTSEIIEGQELKLPKEWTE